MCGIAGLIHRGNTSKVGFELQGMLQALNIEEKTLLDMRCTVRLTVKTL